MRPFEHLPVPFPCDYDPGPAFFYNNFVKKFVPDMLQMMETGIHIDPKKVEELRATIDEVQKTVYERLSKSPIIAELQKRSLPAAQKAHEENATKSIRTADDYLSVYKTGDMVHRTWVVNTYLKSLGRDKDCKEKWSVADLKKYNIFLKDSLVSAIIEKRALADNSTVKKGMVALAEYKAELWNRPRYEKAKEKVTLPAFNPNSSTQITAMFEMLEIEPIAFSKDTGAASWGRKQLDIIKATYADHELQFVLDTLIDNSFSAIIKNNFLKAFDTFTVDGVLHGTISIFGAKSFRNTSKSPNLLNAPSTASIYAKPLKACFVACSPDVEKDSKEDKVVYTVDLGALEDRVIANLSDDENKKDVFKEGLDGHSLNACGYYPARVETVIGKHPTITATVKAFMEAVGEENKLAVAIRQESKGPTFKLAYGGYPDAHKGGVITQEIFDNYHNVLYPGITDYRENYVLKTVKELGYIHLGLGCRIYSDDPEAHIRTLHNATVQFWSVLTLISVNEINHRIREEGLTEDIQVTSTIYDSIYFRVTKDPEIVKWLNDNIIEIMTTEYLQDEEIHNVAAGEVGYNWADLSKIINGASVYEISEVLNSLEKN